MLQSKVIVNLSNRHLHLSPADLAILFGVQSSLTKLRDLMQPGQFAAKECLAIVGPKGRIEGVRVLGPTRGETQCEILASDVYTLGVSNCPCCESGHLDTSLPFQIIGPKASLTKSRGLIIAQRHIHFTPADALEFGVQDKEIVSLKVGNVRKIVFYNLVCRVSPNFALECHLDFDEGNAAGIASGSLGEVIKGEKSSI